MEVPVLVLLTSTLVNNILEKLAVLLNGGGVGWDAMGRDGMNSRRILLSRNTKNLHFIPSGNETVEKKKKRAVNGTTDEEGMKDFH
ncbi:hypothetical protein V1477_008375 [Vespula maculifrons]|uniref:Uncharacterized protein n=1 Tax=Vespula maculifrons TaxID=7453 RepID=A0ABD2CCU6_VESMC